MTEFIKNPSDSAIQSSQNLSDISSYLIFKMEENWGSERLSPMRKFKLPFFLFKQFFLQSNLNWSLMYESH